MGDLSSILDWEDPLEKGNATHISILAWRIPWTVQSMGLQSQTRLRDFHVQVLYNIVLASAIHQQEPDVDHF